ncbi:RNA polymerase I associated factor, A49-like protein [Stachybotrys elegans]|uniref:RNA polymerase I associated factor, A49-like protein n=1 Tax=Stachybotrys elegans TaxID=80388 RepID=A0A8K0WV76_9HYPO|nr:RNA polymerase I associated factor, A49-like protein [Stachybotrys elegans]
MAPDSTKKRKRDGESAAAKPKKKVVVNAPASTTTVSSLLQPKTCPPVIATTAGIQLPDGLTFHSYQRKSDAKKKSGLSINKPLLLHSAEHRTLDYTAKEEDANHLNHFLGVYDPKTGKMEVIQAKKMVVRGTVRAKQASAASMGEKTAKQTMMERRTDLGQTFGTKKAKKAIQDNVMNALSPVKKSGDNTPMKVDDATRAMLDAVGEVTSTMATREELQAVVDEAKPVPKANLDAEEIQDVYDPEAIIGANVLSLVPVREWQEKVRQGENVQLPSRYVAARLNNVASNESDNTRLRVLRYLLFVILFYRISKPGRQRGMRQVPTREKLKEQLSPAPEAVIESIRRKFSDAGQMRKFHIDLLLTHCCAFACIVDNFDVDTQQLRDDLRLDQKTMNQYFYEIGARVRTSKKQEGAVTMARLALPLEFPKQRHIAPRRK